MILECKKREGKGKEVSRKMRTQGNIPGVVYGKQTEPVSIMFKHNELIKFLKNNHGKPVLTINVDGDEKSVIIKEKQEKPWKNLYTHIDFQEIHKGEIVHLTMPIHFEGAEIIEKTGGILVKALHEVNIACLVKDIPNSIVVNVSELGVHESIHVSDLNLGESVKISEAEERTICSVTLPRAAVEATSEEEAGEENTETPEAE